MLVSLSVRNLLFIGDSAQSNITTLSASYRVYVCLADVFMRLNISNKFALPSALKNILTCGLTFFFCIHYPMFWFMTSLNFCISIRSFSLSTLYFTSLMLDIGRILGDVPEMKAASKLEISDKSMSFSS